MPKGGIGEAQKRPDNKWEVRHEDGSTEVLSDKQFNEQYVVEEEPVETKKPEVVTGEQFPQDSDYVGDYLSQVEEELKRYENGIRNVRAEIKAAKSSKGESDFAALRHAIHELSHGNPLTRTAHAVTVNHDGPERLQPPPTAESNVCSGSGEETNADVVSARHAGR
jgi:hypothetical protein